mgnify:CR=1 FL=1
MKIKYFQDTDTLLLILSEQDVLETKDIDENTILDLDKEGKIVSITIEHAKERVDIDSISFEQIKSDLVV